jgi:hypothetical protein
VVAPEILVLTEKTRVCVCVFFMGTSMVAVGWAGAAGRYNATDTCGEWVESAGKASQTPGNPQCVAAGGAYNMGVSFSVFSAPPTNTHSSITKVCGAEEQRAHASLIGGSVGEGR